MEGEVNRVVDVDKLRSKAREKINELRSKAQELDVSKLGAQAQEKFNELRSSSKAGAAKTPQPGGEGP